MKSVEPSKGMKFLEQYGMHVRVRKGIDPKGYHIRAKLVPSGEVVGGYALFFVEVPESYNPPDASSTLVQ